MPALDTITNTLNYYGGWISLVSLVFSVFLAVLTGNIKKNIKLILEHKDLNNQRAKIQRSLAKNIESICQNIQTLFLHFPDLMQYFLLYQCLFFQALILIPAN